MRTNAPHFVDEVVRRLRKRYGAAKSFGKSRLYQFGSALTCSINYSKQLRGEKYFFGLAQETVDPKFDYPPTHAGGFVILVCGSPDKVLILPRPLVLDAMRKVPTRKLDVFTEGDTYILQTTGHPKINVTQFLNAFPASKSIDREPDESSDLAPPDRAHVKIQGGLIQLGRAEGCSVWVPPSDRNLSYKGESFAAATLERLPNFGFDENTRRIVQNIDVLWLIRNVIHRAFEVESTTSIYSGLLRLNDLVLAQPNNQIALFIVAPTERREKVFNQLIRPSFHALAGRCEFLSFENVDDTVNRVESVSGGKSVRVSGLLEGERFEFDEHYIYPTGV
ncbi:MAG: hypothetical protein ABR589_01485 [Chthoniobacterales bacterium]